jgi:hypothetical protein
VKIQPRPNDRNLCKKYGWSFLGFSDNKQFQNRSKFAAQQSITIDISKLSDGELQRTQSIKSIQKSVKSIQKSVKSIQKSIKVSKKESKVSKKYQKYPKKYKNIQKSVKDA